MKSDPFIRAKNRIYQDADDIFNGLMEHVRDLHLGPDKQRDLVQVKRRITDYVASVLGHKEILLLDTLLNHLTRDALEVLTGADAPTKNRFHAYNRAWIEKAKTTRNSTTPERLQFSPDRRFAYSAGASLIAGGGVRLLAAGTTAASLQVPLVLGTIAITAFLAFQATSHQTFRAIERDAEQYLNACKMATLAVLNDVIDQYRANFADFVVVAD
jgi:hypothetical protein